MGVFATRSPHRPNPIGLSLAELRGVDYKQKRLDLTGLDLIDGTPILDIKPYHPADRLQNFMIPDWLEEAEQNNDELEVEMGENIIKEIKNLAG